MKTTILPEDKKLLDRFEKIGPLSTGTELEEQKREMLKIQTEAILRNRKTSIDLDHGNTRLAKIGIAFALMQFVISILQAGFDFMDGENKLYGFLKVCTLAVFVIYMMRTLDKEI